MLLLTHSPRLVLLARVRILATVVDMPAPARGHMVDTRGDRQVSYSVVAVAQV